MIDAMYRYLPTLCFLVTSVPGLLFGQSDTIRITIGEAEQKFLQSNLQVLAARFNVDASRAAITQAGLWSNPTVSLEQNIYNQYTKRWFDFSEEGNTGLQIQQLLVLAGKRDKQSRLATVNAEMAEETFSEVMRALKLELRSAFYDLHFLRQSLGFYNESISMLDSTVTRMETVYERRAVLLSELLRLKALLFSLENERLSILGRIADTEGNLKVLLRDTAAVQRVYVPLLDTARLDHIWVDSLSLSEAVAMALEHRPDFKKAEAAVRSEEANLSLQKAMAVPDLTVGGLWSRAGSYIPNYYALTISIDLPFLNRNQGNIEMSQRTLQANTMLRDNYRAQVVQDVAIALQRARQADRLYRSFDRKFPLEYEKLVQGAIANYQKRNMSVLEFTDFIESYRTSMLQMNQLENDRANAIEALNYAVGADMFNPEKARQ